MFVSLFPHREEVRNRGLSVAVDAREAPKSAVEIITEALQVLEVSFLFTFSCLFVSLNIIICFVYLVYDSKNLTHHSVYTLRLAFVIATS